MPLSVTLNTIDKIANIFVESYSIVKIISPKRKTFNERYA